MYDSHMHSNFSSDCKYSMEDMIIAAIEKRAKTITFTDHVDFSYGSRKIDILFNIQDYFKEIKRLKNKYKNDIEILCGLELGMQPHILKKVNEVLNDNNFDFILMSIHTAKGFELIDEGFYIGKTPKLVYEDYYSDLLEILNTFNNFDVVGHIDIIERYNKYTAKAEFDDYKEFLTEVLKKIISMDKGIELNTSGIRYGLNSFHPNVEILKLYKNLGGEIVTIGSDAHNPKYICEDYKNGIDLLKDVGFKNICIFRNRRKQVIKI